METNVAVLEAPAVNVAPVLEAVQSLGKARWQDLPLETLQAMRKDREEGGATWKSLEGKYNLIPTNGMSSYNAVKKLRSLEGGLPVAHRSPAKVKTPRNAFNDGAGI